MHAAIMEFLQKQGLTDLTDHDAFFDLFYGEDVEAGPIHELLLQGMSYDEMAKARFVSRETIKTHVKSVFRKLGASSQVELLARLRPSTRD